MKLFVLGIGVCCLGAIQVWAQSSGRPASSQAISSQDILEHQRIDTFMLEHGLNTPRANSGHLNWPEGAKAASAGPAGSSVVSLQALEHSSNRDARRLEKKGMREFGREQFEEALPAMRHAVDPQSSSYENNLGVLYCVMGRDEEAQEAFERAVVLDTSAVISYRNLASVAFNTYQYKLAEDSARRALRLMPLSPEANIMLALAEVAQNHWTSEAKRALMEYRSRVPEAERILKTWPGAGANGTRSHVVSVQGAGPGAFRLSVH